MKAVEMPLVLGAIAVVLGAAIIAVRIFRNAAPVDSIAQVLHDVEHPTDGAPGRGRRR